MTVAYKVENLKAGASMQLSKFNNITCSVERSGDGKILRFVRTFENGSFEVFREVSF